MLTSIENVVGSLHDDNFTGDAGDNRFDGYDGDDVFIGGGGQDYFTGGAGIDTIDYSGASARINVDLNGDTAWENGHGSWDRIYTVENITGTDHNDIIVGRIADDVNHFIGGAGDDE